MPEDPIQTYDDGYVALAKGWERLPFQTAHATVLPYIPKGPGIVIDIGAGSGRDAAWFAASGWTVIAVEPAERLRVHARERHPSQRISWENDSLPELRRLLGTGITGDLLWVSAVWMHVAPNDRRRAFRKLVTLMKPGGRLMISLRDGPPPYDRPMFPVSVEEIEALSQEHGLVVRATLPSSDAMGRPEIRWTSVILELPDDGTGALPLIRGIILQDAKAATYKLALLRVIARIADQSPSFARYGETHAEIPLGLVALYWLRMFKRLVEEDIPQAPRNRGGTGLGFVKQAFWQMDVASPVELRPGNRFGWPRSNAIAAALGDAAYTIARMPAHYIKLHSGRPIFPTVYRARPTIKAGEGITIDRSLLWSYGETLVPLHIWATLRRLAAWIEPMLITEWIRLIGGYAHGQDRHISLGRIAQALRWIDPERDTLEIRKIAAQIIARGDKIYCAWSGALIHDVSELAVDHCFPFAAWPCDDLWNLLPTTRRVNGSKHDKLVTGELLAQSAPRIATWWEQAYRAGGETYRALRFQEEALATLPVDGTSVEHGPNLFGLAEAPARDSPIFAMAARFLSNEEIFGGMQYQRLRLKQDQNLPEWRGPQR